MADLQKTFAAWKPILRFQEPLSRHTSFRIGGPADAFARPRSVEELAALLKRAREAETAVFVIGAGANILVSDKGFRGLVVSLDRFRDLALTGDTAAAGAGLAVGRLARLTARSGFQGLERFAAMPGSVGGAVWMNARCYESSFADCLAFVTVLDHGLETRRLAVSPDEFGYKRSPFQLNGQVILAAEFALSPADPRALKTVMREIERDRKAKGHFSAPCAGSVFKNDRRFGGPTGQLLDELGLKGTRSGGAEISVRHANVIQNRRRATAADVKALVRLMEEKVKERYGFDLEREILYIGED